MRLMSPRRGGGQRTRRAGAENGGKSRVFGGSGPRSRAESPRRAGGFPPDGRSRPAARARVAAIPGRECRSARRLLEVSPWSMIDRVRRRRWAGHDPSTAEGPDRGGGRPVRRRAGDALDDQRLGRGPRAAAGLGRRRPGPGRRRAGPTGRAPSWPRPPGGPTSWTPRSGTTSTAGSSSGSERRPRPVRGGRGRLLPPRPQAVPRRRRSRPSPTPRKLADRRAGARPAASRGRPDRDPGRRGDPPESARSSSSRTSRPAPSRSGRPRSWSTAGPWPRPGP